MIVRLPAATVGVFCTVCRSVIGFSMYPAVEVEVAEGTAVKNPRPLRLVIGGCQGNPAGLHPWITRFVQRTDGTGGEQQIA